MRSPALGKLAALTASLTTAAVLTGCLQQQPAVPGDDASAPQPASDSAVFEAAMAEVVRVAPRSSSAWPGFRLHEQVLVVTAPAAGLVIVAGDDAPNTAYVAHPRHPSLRYWRGAPPDSLPMLELATDWNRTRGAATIVRIPDGAIAMAAMTGIHEAFHTFQMGLEQRDSTRFPQVGTADFPVNSLEAVALLNLESRHLGMALTEPDVRRAADHVRNALAVRHHRCRDDAVRCTAERGIEHHEGAAVYVTSQLLGRVDGYGAAGAWHAPIVRAISPVRERGRLPRWHFYDTGLIWYTLVGRFSGDMPYSTLERLPPDIVLARILDFDPAADSTSRAGLLAGPLYAQALDDARALQQAWELASAARQAAAGPVVPLRVIFGHPKSIQHSTGADPQRGTVRSVAFGDNRIEFVGESSRICCPQGERVLVPVEGRTAVVDGVSYRLDVPGTATGALTIRTETLQVTMPRAELRILADSVIITALPER